MRRCQARRMLPCGNTFIKQIPSIVKLRPGEETPCARNFTSAALAHVLKDSNPERASALLIDCPVTLGPAGLTSARVAHRHHHLLTTRTAGIRFRSGSDRYARLRVGER